MLDCLIRHRVSSVIGFRLVAAGLVLASFIGCSSQRVSEPMVISSMDYEQVFDAAVEVARGESLIGGLRDRRTGVIETDPTFAPTLFEPWHAHREDWNSLVESTISFQRRRARFEFIPQQSDDRFPTDMTAYQGDLEVRVFVHVDRLHTVGRRRSTWTRRVASFEEIHEDPDMVRRSWVPIGRDEAMEQRLLKRLMAASDH